jgi:hypothetical protein
LMPIMPIPVQPKYPNRLTQVGAIHILQNYG